MRMSFLAKQNEIFIQCIPELARFLPIWIAINEGLKSRKRATHWSLFKLASSNSLFNF